MNGLSSRLKELIMQNFRPFFKKSPEKGRKIEVENKQIGYPSQL